MVLELARPSEPWCFAAGSCFFRSYCTGISSSSLHLRAAAGDRLSRKKLFFQDFRRHVRQFFSVVLKLARSLEPMVFCCRELPAGAFFEAIFLRVAAGNRISRQMLFFYRIFSRISDDRLGSFLAWFWNLLVFQSHSVLLPGTAFFEAG